MYLCLYRYRFWIKKIFEGAGTTLIFFFIYLKKIFIKYVNLFLQIFQIKEIYIT